MAFSFDNLKGISNGLFEYRTSDTLSQVLSPGYFDVGGVPFTNGDRVDVVFLVDGSVSSSASILVTEITGSSDPTVSVSGTPLYEDLLSGGAVVATRNATANVSETATAAENSAAFDSLVSNYDYIVVPPGTYPVNVLDYTGSGKTIVGAGYSSELQGQSGQAAVIKLGDGSTTTQNWKICGLRLSGAATKGFHSDAVSRIHIEDIVLDGLTATDGFVFDTTFGSYLGYLRTAGGTISQYGFACNTDFNANVCDMWYTSNANQTNNIRVTGGNGSTWNTPTCQGGDIGFHAYGGSGHTVNSLYTENTLSALTCGHAYDSLASGWTFNGGLYSAPYQSHDEYANRIACIFLYYASNMVFNSPNISGVFDAYGNVSATFSGGGGSGAKALVRVHPDGDIHSVHVVRPGSGYTTDPTISFGGSGSGATATVTRSGNTVSSVTVTDGGSGFAGDVVNTCPVAVLYDDASAITIVSPKCNVYGTGTNGPFYPAICQATSASSASKITVINATTDRADFDGGQGLVRGAQGLAHRHFVEELDSSGSIDRWEYIPPLFTT